MSAEEFARVVSQTSNATNGDENDHELNTDEASASFLTKHEQIAVFMNLAIPAIVSVPRGLSQETTPRCAPRK